LSIRTVTTQRARVTTRRLLGHASTRRARAATGPLQRQLSGGYQMAPEHAQEGTPRADTVKG
jgi:hypothetical protein